MASVPNFATRQRHHCGTAPSVQPLLPGGPGLVFTFLTARTLAALATRPPARAGTVTMVTVAMVTVAMITGTAGGTGPGQSMLHAVGTGGTATTARKSVSVGSKIHNLVPTFFRGTRLQASGTHCCQDDQAVCWAQWWGEYRKVSEHARIYLTFSLQVNSPNLLREIYK